MGRSTLNGFCPYLCSNVVTCVHLLEINSLLLSQCLQDIMSALNFSVRRLVSMPASSYMCRLELSLVYFFVSILEVCLIFKSLLTLMPNFLLLVASILVINNHNTILSTSGYFFLSFFLRFLSISP